jgi:hypothetical protein
LLLLIANNVDFIYNTTQFMEENNISLNNIENDLENLWWEKEIQYKIKEIINDPILTTYEGLDIFDPEICFQKYSRLGIFIDFDINEYETLNHYLTLLNGIKHEQHINILNGFSDIFDNERNSITNLDESYFHSLFNNLCIDPLSFLNSTKYSTINIDLILTFINKNPFFKLSDLVQTYNNQMKPNTVSKKLIRQILRKEIVMRYRKVKLRNPFCETNKFLQCKYYYIKKFLYYLSNGYVLIYTDESNFNFLKNDMKVWTTDISMEKSLYGKYIQYDESNKKSCTLILSTSIDNVDYYTFELESNTNVTFFNYFDGLYKRVSSKYDMNKVVFYFDNLKQHRSKALLSYIYKRELKIMYGVKYYPNFNLCESVFGFLKSKIKTILFKNM